MYVIFVWNTPATPNGVITEYQLQCSGRGKLFSRTVMGSQTTTTLSGLLPYTSYFCSITAHTSVGGGPAATTSVTTQQDSEFVVNQYQYYCLLQSPVDLLKTLLYQQSPFIHLLSPGLLLSPYNVMESSSAISSPAAQEAASSTAPEPAVPV